VRALGFRHCDAVLLGAAAARVSFWPDAPLDRIEAAVPSALKPQPGFFFNRRYIPAELIIERAGLRYSVPARERLQLLIDSRGKPWSAAERLSHRLLRAAHIKG
jgi:hypothetical protein